VIARDEVLLGVDLLEDLIAQLEFVGATELGNVAA